MFKKSIASVVSAAVLVAGPGHLTLTAAAQTMSRPVASVSLTPMIGTGLNSPVAGASSFNAPSLGALNAPALLAAPITPALEPAALAAQMTPAAAVGSPLALILSHDIHVGVEAKGTALNAFFENRTTGHEAIEVLGQSAAAVGSGLALPEVTAARSPVAVERAGLEKAQSGGLLVELGIGAAAVALLAAVSAPFRNLVARGWNATLGILGIGVKKLETPAVMAQRIIDQLNEAKPVYNRKVQEASTLVEKLKLQVKSETAKVAELEQGITALLSDSDPTNDVMATGLINQQKTLNGSITATNEQITLAESTLQHIKDERTRFFAEREETIAKIQAGLTKAAAADIQKQIAELKGGFSVGDLNDNMGKFEDAVNDKVADANGTTDAVNSNPDEVLKRAKDSLKSADVLAEIAKRKAAIEEARKAKTAAGGSASLGEIVASIGGVVLGLIASLSIGPVGIILAMVTAVPVAFLIGDFAGAYVLGNVVRGTPAETIKTMNWGARIGGVLGVSGAIYAALALAGTATAVSLIGLPILGAISLPIFPMFWAQITQIFDGKGPAGGAMSPPNPGPVGALSLVLIIAGGLIGGIIAPIGLGSAALIGIIGIALIALAIQIDSNGISSIFGFPGMFALGFAAAQFIISL